ncbi:hypothetical protein [Lentzea sp. NPDC003310]|uniref:hypothetical protein n=1 Tax=Lentzea sp. NPDC003310 TaxID=3154447 RepID=UPI0033B1A49A
MSSGPWWFSGVAALIGVLAGILIKWGIDELAAKRLRNREDRLRFIVDKRKAYADFLNACSEAADAREEHRDLDVEGKELDARTKPSNEDIDVFNAKVERVSARWRASFVQINEAMSVVELLAPTKVVEAAGRFVALCYRPHLLPRRIEAERLFIAAAREDLGAPRLGAHQSWQYEPFDDSPEDLAALKPSSPSVGLIEPIDRIAEDQN